MNCYLVTDKFGSSIYTNKINEPIVADAFRIGVIKSVELKWNKDKFDIEIISELVKPEQNMNWSRCYENAPVTAIDIVSFEELRHLSPKYDFIDFCQHFNVENLVALIKNDPIEQLMMHIGYHHVLSD
jgi:hypothetical protein